MDESPAPPVPEKDPQYQARASSSMGLDRSPAAGSPAPASGSKRKREAPDGNAHNHRERDHRTARLEVTDGEDNGRTPSKRSRSIVRSDGDYDLSDEPPAQQPGLRRKNGSRNLSNLNLHHAASVQKQLRSQHSPPRESKFQEGSLNDRPSEKPPSVFTRFPRTDSADLEYVDELMAGYHHDGLPTPTGSMERVIEHEKATMPQRVAKINAQRDSESETPGMFRFGRSLASNFHPVALWNRLWNDTKDELTRQNMSDAEKKARTKAEAEAKYAQMKRTGQLGLQPVSAAGSHDMLSTPHEATVALDSAIGHHRTMPGSAQVRPSNETSRDGSEASEPPRAIRGRLSRLHLRKPSMASLTGTIKRTKSEFNLAAAADRESSSSLSPVKAAFDGGSVVRRSHSKYDLKKQNRLSKRVSDLESKLNKARAELDVALAEASPLPKLGNRFERFTPTGSVRRPQRFTPGALPTLPSERLLDKDGNLSTDNSQPDRPSNTIDLSKAFDDIDDDETVKPSRTMTYPARAQDLFKHPDSPIEHEQHHGDGDPVISKPEEASAPEIDANDIVNPSGVPKVMSSEKPANETLDAKLEALDATVKAGKKTSKSKKRVGLNKDDSGSFRPARDDVGDDDAEWEEAEKSAKKKRKSAGEIKDGPQTKRANASGKQKPPQTKPVKKSIAKTKKKTIEKKESVKSTTSKSAEDVEMGDALGSEDELAKLSSRSSMDEETQSLEPLYEEEEETTVHRLKGEPLNPTATATPAKYGRTAVRSCSNSPPKRPEPSAETQMMFRAAEAAVQSRPSRSASPPATAYSKRLEVVNETVTVVPGKDGVPTLPTGGNGNFERIDDVESTGKMLRSRTKQAGQEKNFEWPDDVF